MHWVPELSNSNSGSPLVSLLFGNQSSQPTWMAATSPTHSLWFSSRSQPCSMKVGGGIEAEKDWERVIHGCRLLWKASSMAAASPTRSLSHSLFKPLCVSTSLYSASWCLCQNVLGSDTSELSKERNQISWSRAAVWSAAFSKKTISLRMRCTIKALVSKLLSFLDFYKRDAYKYITNTFFWGILLFCRWNNCWVTKKLVKIHTIKTERIGP